jgi:uncharacterized membrane protein YhaH (DUF805 family)
MRYVWLLFGFRGRINRARYLAVQLSLLAVWFVLWVKFPLHFASQWDVLSSVVAITMIWINLATTAKRLHDHNQSGWWAIAIFVLNRLTYAYCGLFFGNYFGVDISIVRELLLVLSAVALSLLQTCVVIELFFLAGTEGPNRFGPDPTRGTLDSRSDLSHQPTGVPEFLASRADPSPRG